jgi:hypothetical protein
MVAAKWTTNGGAAVQALLISMAANWISAAAAGSCRPEWHGWVEEVKGRGCSPTSSGAMVARTHAVLGRRRCGVGEEEKMMRR